MRAFIRVLRCDQLINFGMDLTPLVQDDKLDPAQYVDGFIRRFAGDVSARIRRFA